MNSHIADNHWSACIKKTTPVASNIVRAAACFFWLNDSKGLVSPCFYNVSISAAMLKRHLQIYTLGKKLFRLKFFFLPCGHSLESTGEKVSPI